MSVQANDFAKIMAVVLFSSILNGLRVADCKRKRKIIKRFLLLTNVGMYR